MLRLLSWTILATSSTVALLCGIVTRLTSQSNLPKSRRSATVVLAKRLKKNPERHYLPVLHLSLTKKPQKRKSRSQFTMCISFSCVIFEVFFIPAKSMPFPMKLSDCNKQIYIENCSMNYFCGFVLCQFFSSSCRKQLPKLLCWEFSNLSLQGGP